MTVPFLNARFDECRTPRWTDVTPIADRMVCGAPTISGRSYCSECRKVLISGVVDKNGEARWFNPSVSARWRAKADGDDNAAATGPETEILFDSPDVGSAKVTTETTEEAEPEGAGPLQPADLCDWGMAA